MTATRFYFATGGTAAAAPAFNAGWDITTSAVSRPLFLASELGTGSSASDSSHAETSTSVVNRLKRQHVSQSQVTSAHTISGTADLVIKAFESSSSADLYLQCIISLWDSTGTTLRGVLYSGQTATSVSSTTGDPNQEWTTTPGQTRLLSVTLTSQAAQVGDRIVVELGYRACNSSASSFGGTFQLNDQSASSDFAFTANLSTSIRPWIEFSDDIFGASGATVGDAALAATATITDAGVVGTATGSAVTATATTTTAGAVGKSAGSSVAATATVTATGSVGKASGAAVAATATVTASGTVISGLGSGATIAATSTATAAGAVGAVGAAAVAAVDAIAAAGTVGRSGSASVAATDAIAATAVVGKATSAAIAAGASITAAGVVGLSADAAVSATVTVTATGSGSAVGVTVRWWDGTTAQSATLLGWWDGTTTRPVELLGWWDGATTQPLA